MDQNQADIEKPLDANPQTESQQVKKRDFRYLYLGLFILVLLIVASVFIIVPSLKKNEELSTTVTGREIPSNMFLTLEYPEADSIAVDQETLVKGRTLPGSTVLIFTDADEETVQSDSQGNFETTIVLSDTSDVLSVTAVSPQGEEKTLDLEINVNAEEL
ncbi:MAG: hypothetical protein UV73_C0003G0036 [Candidatus Gottesmanbacteria bacterium GW2011_GWA2_43_14]|uniref:Bacterial Ig domain-containing protein n=1 Tax=Candidatus Gottesmanbacteria bacterium GW2011_GWA2_43_14 TaxID=1618443 RepID=A0A0G1DKD3_9BACT|nr:MAG: hypothetical protein UV73_C0003G0036 [Candidatus Gottesmanbacteria bacterium GW2011_GWA2_43_14]